MSRTDCFSHTSFLKSNQETRTPPSLPSSLLFQEAPCDFSYVTSHVEECWQSQTRVNFKVLFRAKMQIPTANLCLVAFTWHNFFTLQGFIWTQDSTRLSKLETFLWCIKTAKQFNAKSKNSPTMPLLETRFIGWGRHRVATFHLWVLIGSSQLHQYSHI